MDEQTEQKPKKDIKTAERAVDHAFSTGKVDRATVTRQAQLDAAEAVAMAGVAMESDAEADEAGKLALIAAGLGNRDRIKETRERERLARNKAKQDHRAATKSAKQAYDAIKFSDPTKLGFLRVVQVYFLAHIVFTLVSLILTSRDTVVYNSINIGNWISVVLEGVAFYFFVNRYKIGRPFVIGMSVAVIVIDIVFDFIDGHLNPVEIFLENYFFVFLILYFTFSKRVKATLINDLSTDKGVMEEEFVIDRRGWPFYRNLIIYFVIFSILGHWMEAAMCQLIRLGIVRGEYDPSNTMLWRDWLYPYPMEGAAVVLIALFLYPLFTELKKRFPNNRFLPYIISFVANGLLCTIIEFIGGILFNAQHQHWDYSDMPFNFMGQVCLQNALAFGAAASIICWWVYPMMERAIARVRPAVMNIVCIIVAIAGGVLFSLYLISPPEGIDLGITQRITESEDYKTLEDRNAMVETANIARNTMLDLSKTIDESKSLTADEAQSIQEHIKVINTELDEITGVLVIGSSKTVEKITNTVKALTANSSTTAQGDEATGENPGEVTDENAGENVDEATGEDAGEASSESEEQSEAVPEELPAAA